MFMIPVCNYCPIYQLLIVGSTIFNQLLVMTYDLQVTIFFIKLYTNCLQCYLKHNFLIQVP